MKIKLAILGLAVTCLWGRQLKADTAPTNIVVDFSTTACTGCFGGGLDFNANLDVRITAQLVEQNFFLYVGAVHFDQLGYEILDMTGTFNGFPVSYTFRPAPDTSWLFPGFSLGPNNFVFGLSPGYVNFIVNGESYIFWDDFGQILLEGFGGPGPGAGGGGPVNYTATLVGTPEPSILVLLGIGLAGLGWRRLTYTRSINTYSMSVK